TTMMPPKVRAEVHEMLEIAIDFHSQLGTRDPELTSVLGVPLMLYEVCLAVLDAFDEAWKQYHQAALIEGDPQQRADFYAAIDLAVQAIHNGRDAVTELRYALQFLESTGHTPYDAYILEKHCDSLTELGTLIHDLAKD